MSRSNPPLKPGDEIDSKVDRLANGGNGIILHHGLIGFVALVAPDDLVRVRVTAVKKNYFEAELVTVLQSGATRVEPRCPEHGACGGCGWQQISYSQQLIQKQKILDSMLRKRHLPSSTLPIVPSPQQWNYRNRVQIRASGAHLGYFKRNSHQIVPIEFCSIADPKINEAFSKIRGSTEGASDKVGKWELTLLPSGQVHASQNHEHGEVLGFSQVNQELNLLLIQEIQSLTKTISPAEIWDLYGGQGNLTFPLAEVAPAAPVVSVELSAAASRHAKQIAKDRNLENRIQVIQEDVGKYLRKARPAPGLLVVLDPPRMGPEASVLQELKRLKPQWIIYVSCNPSILIRDLSEKYPVPSQPLIEDYEVFELRAFDMFPQTAHLEVLAALKLRS